MIQRTVATLILASIMAGCTIPAEEKCTLNAWASDVPEGHNASRVPEPLAEDDPLWRELLPKLQPGVDASVDAPCAQAIASMDAWKEAGGDVVAPSEDTRVGFILDGNVTYRVVVSHIESD